MADNRKFGLRDLKDMAKKGIESIDTTIACRKQQGFLSRKVHGRKGEKRLTVLQQYDIFFIRKRHSFSHYTGAGQTARAE